MKRDANFARPSWPWYGSAPVLDTAFGGGAYVER